MVTNIEHFDLSNFQHYIETLSATASTRYQQVISCRNIENVMSMFLADESDEDGPAQLCVLELEDVRDVNNSLSELIRSSPKFPHIRISAEALELSSISFLSEVSHEPSECNICSINVANNKLVLDSFISFFSGLEFSRVFTCVMHLKAGGNPFQSNLSNLLSCLPATLLGKCN